MQFTRFQRQKKHTQTMSGRHCNHEGENVVDESVEGLIHKCAPRKMGNRFELIVEEQLRQHEQESERVDAIRETFDQPTEPGLVRYVYEAEKDT